MREGWMLEIDVELLHQSTTRSKNLPANTINIWVVNAITRIFADPTMSDSVIEIPFDQKENI